MATEIALAFHCRLHLLMVVPETARFDRLEGRCLTHSARCHTTQSGDGKC